MKTLSSSLFTCGSTEGPLAGSSNIHNVSLQTYTMYLFKHTQCICQLITIAPMYTVKYSSLCLQLQLYQRESLMVNQIRSRPRTRDRCGQGKYVIYTLIRYKK